MFDRHRHDIGHDAGALRAAGDQEIERAALFIRRKGARGGRKDSRPHRVARIGGLGQDGLGCLAQGWEPRGDGPRPFRQRSGWPDP